MPRLARPGLALLLLLLPLACRFRDGNDGGAALGRTPVLREATLVAFTLRDSDTLPAGEEQDGLAEFRSYTALVVPMLADLGVAFHATTADSIVIERDDGVRRVVMLRGLDHPYGYVLVEPGYAEHILTGVLTEVELEEELDWYFGDSDQEEEEPPRHLSVRPAVAPDGAL